MQILKAANGITLTDVRPRALASRTGSVDASLMVILAVLALLAMSMIFTTARRSNAAGLDAQGARALGAAEAAANMAIKELIDNNDRDGDGAVGTISNDSNSSTDPTINNGTRLWTTKTTSGTTTTLTAQGRNADASRSIQVVLVGSGDTTVGSVLFVVNNSSSLDSQELAKKSLLESWGHTVVPISGTASQASFDAAVLAASVVYISETVMSSDVGTKLTSAKIGVITEESALSDELGMSASMTTFSGTQININNTSHYITSTLSSGVHTIFSSSQPVRYLSGTLGSITTLGQQPSTTNPTFAVMERGDTLTPSGTAAGRRVYLPFGNTGYDVASLTADGLTIMKRSIEWCLLPIARYKLDDASGSTAVDSIASRNGTLVGPTWTTGNDGGALNFDGVDDYVSIADNAVFRVTDALSITGWIRATSWPNDSDWASTILRKGDANPNNWELEVNLGKVVLVLDDYDAYGIRGNTTLATNTWYHVAATWDGSYVRIYVNGVLDNTPTARAAPISTDTRALYLGGRISSTDVTAGKVDDVRFYNRALTAVEVAAIAAGGRPRVTNWKQINPSP